MELQFGCFLVLLMMCQFGCHAANYQEKVQSFEEKVFAHVANFTPAFAKSTLEDRMYDLNTRFLSILINKVVKDDAKIWSKLEAERRSYSEAIESLKTEYHEEIQTVDRLQSEVITLETQTIRLKESGEDFKSKYQHMLDNYMKQSETVNELELKLRNTQQTLEQRTQEYVEVEEKNTALREASCQIESYIYIKKPICHVNMNLQRYFNSMNVCNLN
ncbi:uncharacterized protein LOC134708643 [Mytilus trossulus]|uniref:uncharacterized protein LOC134708643 n=1 Tax=Mytilus trossulus TaxID=6551 RepID=UPI003005C6DF